MPPKRTRSPARLLAPLALLVFVLAVALVVLGSSGSNDSSQGRTTTARQRTATTTKTRAGNGAPSRNRNVYAVKPGDTLGGIAEKTKVQVETLLRLNPALDPQALVSGQKIKLR